MTGKEAVDAIIQGLKEELARTEEREKSSHDPTIWMSAGAQKATLRRMIELSEVIREGME